MTKIIAFCGEKGSGKSTAAEALETYLGGILRRSFASPLKESCGALFGLTDAQLYGDEKEIVDPRYGRTPREILQGVGTFYRETYGADFWVQALARRIEGPIAVIDDCRYPNEAAWIRERGGLVIGIRRPGVGGADGHASERLMREHWEEMIDLEIVNDGDLRELRRAVIEAAERGWYLREAMSAADKFRGRPTTAAAIVRFKEAIRDAAESAEAMAHSLPKPPKRPKRKILRRHRKRWEESQ